MVTFPASSSVLPNLVFTAPSSPTTTRPNLYLSSTSSLSSKLGGSLGLKLALPGSESVLLACAKGESMPATRVAATAVTEARFLCFLVSSDTATQA